MKIGETAARNAHRGRRGTAVLVALIATMVLAGMAASMIAVSGAFERQSETTTRRLRALYAAEAGLAESISNVRAGRVLSVANRDAPMKFGADGYWSSAVNNGDDSFTVTSFGSADGQVFGVEAVVIRQGQGPFTSALFAGNSSGDALYDMKFGGKGAQADVVNGNIFSGGNIKVSGAAKLNGTVWAHGAISGLVGGETGKSAPIPDIAGMNYATNHDVDVAKQFKGATYKSNSGLGGKAWQVSESDPAHIFRKNPDDRTADTVLTAKDDYFLEDPYEAVSSSTTITAASGTRITISGIPGKPGTSGNDKVYYIDGNLWIHNRNLYSFTMYNSGNDGVRVTFVVKGNVYFSDNVLYHDGKKDGVAFIAIKDKSVPDSGNVYFGDPVFGTLEQMDAFMYAENNFYDNNLSATGSAKVTVNGNMTAGNQVRINRDSGLQHSKLTVNFDERLTQRTLSLPGLPRDAGADPTWLVASWRPIAAE